MYANCSPASQNCEVEACSNNLGVMSRYQSTTKNLQACILEVLHLDYPLGWGESIWRQCMHQVRAVMSSSLVQLHFVGHQSLWSRGLEATIGCLTSAHTLVLFIFFCASQHCGVPRKPITDIFGLYHVRNTCVWGSVERACQSLRTEMWVTTCFFGCDVRQVRFCWQLLLWILLFCAPVSTVVFLADSLQVSLLCILWGTRVSESVLCILLVLRKDCNIFFGSLSLEAVWTSLGTVDRTEFACQLCGGSVVVKSEIVLQTIMHFAHEYIQRSRYDP